MNEVPIKEQSKSNFLLWTLPEFVGKVRNIPIFQKDWLKYVWILVTLCFSFPISARDSLSIDYGFELLRQRRASQVLSLSEQLKIQAQRTQDTPLLYDAMNLKANAYRHLGRLDSAIYLHHKILGLRSDYFGEHSFEVANSCNNLGNCYLLREDFSAAWKFLNSCKNIREDLLETPHNDLAKIYNSIGNYYLLKRSYEAAYEAFEDALKMRRALYPSDSPRLLSLLVNHANLLLEIGKPNAAEKHLQEALTIYKKQAEQNTPFAVDIYTGLGNAKWKQNAPETALHFHKKALELVNAQAEYTTPIQWKVLHNIANCYSDLNDLDQAEIYYELAISLFSGNKRERLSLKNNFALNYIYQDKLELAKQIYREIVPIAAGTQELELELAKAYQNLTGYLLRTADSNSDIDLFQTIEFYSQDAIRFYQKNPYTQEQQAKCWNRLGDCFLLQKKYSNAEQCYQEAFSLKKEESAKLNFKLGTLAQEQKKHALALEYFEKAEKAAYPDEISLLLAQAESLQSGLETGLNYTWQQVFTTYETARDKLLRQQSSFQKMSSAVHFRNRYYQVYDGLVESCFALKDTTKAFQYAQESKIGVLHRVLERRQNVADSLLEEEHDLQIQIEHLEQDRLNKPSLDIDTQLENLYQTLEKIELEINQSYQAKTRPTSLQDIQEKLSEQQTIIEYQLTEKYIFAFTISKNNFQAYQFEKTPDFEKKLIQLYQALRLPSDANAQIVYNQLAWEFHQILIAPLQELSQELIIVPSGLLRYLPYEALLTAPAKIPHKFKSRKYLILQHDISYAYSSDLWLQKHQKRAANGKVLAFAPSFEGDIRQLRPLPYSQIEVQNISRITGAKQYSDTTAYEATFKAEAPSYSILHLSTHGILDNENPKYSYLAFSQILDEQENEQLYVSEIYKLDLAADLVVLSACETKLGKMYRGEGLMSIARAFSFAGAKSVVASLWSIDDAQTGQLMEYFYQNLKEQPKQQALSEAKRSFLQAHPSKAHPYYWSACVLIGDVGEVELRNRYRFWIFMVLGLVGSMFLVLSLRKKNIYGK